jgi:hypothetical protein
MDDKAWADDLIEKSDRLRRLSKLLDRLDRAGGKPDGDRKFGLRAPYSDAQTPRPSYWAN